MAIFNYHGIYNKKNNLFIFNNIILGFCISVRRLIKIY